MPIVLGLGAAALLLSAAPARPVQAAAAPLAPAGCENDVLEPNDSYTQATAISVPSVLYGRFICNFPQPQDEDWYSMTLAAGQRVMIFVRFMHAENQDLDLRFYDTDGETDLDSSVGVTNNESISYTVLAAGTYYLRVLGYDASQNTYDLSVSGGCYARAVNEHASADAQAVRDAVAEAAPGSTVKVAGYCPGVANQDGGLQTVLISSTLTLAGGYAPDNWTTAHPVSQPTTLDAMNGGRVISATGTLTLTGLTVQKGRAAGGSSGGGLLLKGNPVLSGTTFYSNTAEFAGGGSFINGYVVITDTNFIENVAEAGQGGGLVALGARISGGRFEGNRATTEGGGLRVSNEVALTGTTFVDNRAGLTGGGAYIGAFVASTVTGASFERNQAGAGGGLGANDDGLTVSGTTFLSNTATSGGGAFAGDGVTVWNSTFTANSAVNGGGLSSAGPLTLVGVTFQSNSALVGGGVSMFNAMHFTATKFISNVASIHGGGLAQVNDEQAERGPQGEAPDPGGRLVNVLFAGNIAPEGLDLRLMATTDNTLLHGTFVASGQPITEGVKVQAGSLTMLNNLLTGYNTAIERTGGSVNEDYNLYFGGGGNVAGFMSGTVTSGGHSLVADPLLANAPIGDYHLTFASPARDAGQYQGVLIDFEGDGRPYGLGEDIGYDELVGYPLSLFLPVVLR